MMSLWKILPLLLALPDPLSSLQRHADTHDGPSCHELRMYWEILSESSKKDYLMNEIPQIPYLMNKVGNSHKPGRRSQEPKVYGDSYKDSQVKNPGYYEPYLEDQHLVPPETFLPFFPRNFPQHEEENEVFEGFYDLPGYLKTLAEPKQKQEMIGPQSNKFSLETDFYIPQWGLPEEVGLFGNFLDSPHMTMTRSPKAAPVRRQDEMFKVSCNTLMNAPCSKNEECLCRGSRLMCLDKKCQNSEEGLKKYGIWHDGPVVPHVHMTNRLKRSRSVYMK